jgi:hypothetical protein
MSSWPSQRFVGFSLRGLLWSAVFSVLLLSYVLHSPDSATSGAHPGPVDWIFQSWPAPFAIALATWLLLQGPLANTRSLVQRGCRFVMVFFIYAGFLYLLKWSPLWNGTQWLGLKNRDKAEGFLILVSTLVWLFASIRVLFPRSRVFAIGAPTVGQKETCQPRSKEARSWFTMKSIAIFSYFFC